MLKEKSFDLWRYIWSGMNKNSLLYIGVFLAGALITPLYLSMFNSGAESPSEADAAAATGFSAPANSGTITTRESTLRPGQSFVPRDSQEAIANDYAVSPEVNIPTSLPQYATNQPSIPSYPNYSAIPPVSLVIPNTSITPSIPRIESLNRREQAIAPQPKTNQPADRLGIFTDDLKENVFIPPANRPDPNAVAPEPFVTSEAIAPNALDLDNFIDNNTTTNECTLTSGNPFRANRCS